MAKFCSPIGSEPFAALVHKRPKVGLMGCISSPKAIRLRLQATYIGTLYNLMYSLYSQAPLAPLYYIRPCGFQDPTLRDARVLQSMHILSFQQTPSQTLQTNTIDSTNVITFRVLRIICVPCSLAQKDIFLSFPILQRPLYFDSNCDNTTHERKE